MTTCTFLILQCVLEVLEITESQWVSNMLAYLLVDGKRLTENIFSELSKAIQVNMQAALHKVDDISKGIAELQISKLAAYGYSHAHLLT